ncbi:ribonuclease HIII [Streptococcus sp. X16XC17]|uniref:ribonuclease HIII n=1 Tax=unclassified Streptococcus TaxID=2608887 RepID=UPI00066FF6C7|nr:MULTISPECIES: ribonuclease HIII [unclassified Streptococcus]TCD45566.1 ribonuclease HIII [Streptococcus sp. X16XC17]
MNTIVLQTNEALKKQLHQAYQTYQEPSKNQYIIAFYKKTGLSVSVYTSGKVVFQGPIAEQEAARFGYQASADSGSSSSSSTPTGQNFPLIGTDEVGNGSYFGGLAVVASFVAPADHAFLKSLGVDDSKKMTDQKICQIAPLLKEKIPHQALLLSPKKYNEVIEQGYNAVSVKVALHNQAIFLLLQKDLTPQKIVIDAFTSPHNYQKYLKNERNQVTQAVTLEEKAEGKYLAVAVSSIIARAMFLENLAQLSQQIGYTLPSGAGAKSDQIASQILKTRGMAGLNLTAKLHFANTKKAQALLK